MKSKTSRWLLNRFLKAAQSASIFPELPQHSYTPQRPTSAGDEFRKRLNQFKVTTYDAVEPVVFSSSKERHIKNFRKNQLRALNSKRRISNGFTRVSKGLENAYQTLRLNE